jgi:hypothetical protein
VLKRATDEDEMWTLAEAIERDHRGVA